MDRHRAEQRLEIRSANGERFRRLAALAGSARERRVQGQTLIEGEHLLQAWLDAGGGLLDEVALPRRSAGRVVLESLCERVARRTLVLEDGLYDRLSQVEHGPGPLASIPVPMTGLPAMIDCDAVYLDGIQDPGNAGTVLRSALAFGVRRVLGSPETVGLWSPKVLRAAMGAHFGLAISEDVSASRLLELCGSARATAADAHATVRIEHADLSLPRVWIFGAEGRGLSGLLAHSASVERLAIAHSTVVESLNVGVAASICLYEQARQRLR